MPSILNLKFKGNKSFVAFSNLADTESLTKTWKVCTKVASYLEQGQRLENLSWRLWHLQNLIVDSDNAKSKREFRKLSKTMGDKLDKEKGRSIEELQAPGFRRNPSTDMIRQRAEEKERNREASQYTQPGTIKRMQFTFSVDQPMSSTSGAGSCSAPAPVSKPDLKPSQEFKDPTAKRAKAHTAPAPRLPPGLEQFDQQQQQQQRDMSDLDKPLTQRGRKSSVSTQMSELSEYSRESASLRFPSLFTSDFGPSALLNPSPTTRSAMTFGEGIGFSGSSSPNDFGIVRPTLEIPLDDILGSMGDSPDNWSGSGELPSLGNVLGDIDMDTSPDSSTGSLPLHPDFKHDSDDSSPLLTTSSLGSAAPLAHFAQDPFQQPVQTIAPSKIQPRVGATTPVGRERPSLSVKTQHVTRSVPGATAASAGPTGLKQSNNSAPGGVKAECSNCGATHTPLWRRGLNDELNCNACGLYCKLHKRPRPKTMRNNHGEGGRAQAAPRQDAVDVMAAQCYNCHTTTTPLWRKDDEGKTVCNACGLYYKLHGSARPISMKSDVIRKRSRHDARRVAQGTNDSPPSISPGASRRASPTAESSMTPTLAPDSTTQITYDAYDFQPSAQSELMNALGGADQATLTYPPQQNAFSALAYAGVGFPGPYHPDVLAQHTSIPADALPFASGDPSDGEDGSGGDGRSTKRRRMSTVSTVSSSATDPPLSATSYSSFDSSPFGTTRGHGTGHSRRGSMSMDFPFNTHAFAPFALLRGSNTFWHAPSQTQVTDSPPTMVNSIHHSASSIHPPMLPPPEESPMDYLHPPMVQPGDDHVADALFATYLHPPMMPPEESGGAHGNGGYQSAHPPMLPNDWNASSDVFNFGSAENAMQTGY